MIGNLIKKVFITAFIIWFFGSFCNAQLSSPKWVEDIPANNPYLKTDDTYTCDPSDLWCLTSWIIIDDEEKSTLNWLLDVFNLNWERYAWAPKFIAYVKFIVNLWLWLISFIALIMLIYTFYMMFFSKSDDGIKKAKWNLKWIFIALAIMWLSWLIVSFIFRWYQSNWQNNTNLLSYLSNNINITNNTNYKIS